MLLDPNWEYKEHERGGGRTTKLMLEAVELMKTWQHVIYLTASQDQANWCAMHFDIIVGDNSLPFERLQKHLFTYDRYNFLQFVSVTAPPLRYLTYMPVPSVLIDHYTYEMAGHTRELNFWLDVAYHRHSALTRRA
jgi:hypothetical protein